MRAWLTWAAARGRPSLELKICSVFLKTNMTNSNLSGIRRKNYKGKLCVGENLSLLFRITQGGLEVSFESPITYFQELPG